MEWFVFSIMFFVVPLMATILSIRMDGRTRQAPRITKRATFNDSSNGDNA